MAPTDSRVQTASQAPPRQAWQWPRFPSHSRLRTNVQLPSHVHRWPLSVEASTQREGGSLQAQADRGVEGWKAAPEQCPGVPVFEGTAPRGIGRVKEGTPATCWPCVLCGAGSRVREPGLPLEGRRRRRIRRAFQVGHRLPTAAWTEQARLVREGSQEGPRWELHLGSETMGPALCGLHSLEPK